MSEADANPRMAATGKAVSARPEDTSATIASTVITAPSRSTAALPIRRARARASPVAEKNSKPAPGASATRSADCPTLSRSRGNTAPMPLRTHPRSP